ncbi:LacI family DNA-binding transcriptional regulator [Alkalicoccus halolimnae]|uniref:LacI family DNA-binding transcriptional regulator n=1 Tax=Alkalicoccus halolimnae TaxID=1667239 RepID=A0A5C7F5X0_9BACI|nr:LacI family DNA-binding transcriptional regulator [Alkalicoccus halolimnae]TXF84651.1 LacI family DNA-binding transcriptional regulator [Alkalicoccus halolimnae]
MATIRDIANKSGYSIATVSRVLNHDQTLSVSHKAKEAIFKYAEELNYKTMRERSARKTISTGTFGMIYFNSEQQEISDPYFLAIRLGIEKECAARGIKLVKLYRNAESFDFSQIADMEGLLIVGRIHPEEIDQLVLYTDNITFIDYSPLDSMFDSVVIDFRTSVIRVLDYLLELSHERIGFIGGQQYVRPDETVMDYREEFFRDYLGPRTGYAEDNIYIGDFSTEDGYRMMKKAVAHGNLPSAFFIASDSMAIGALRALHEHGILVPEDVSIVGFNDIAASRYLQPSLTTVKVHTEFMGQTAVEIMDERRETRRKIPRKIVIPTELIVRESTAAVPAGKSEPHTSIRKVK